MPGTERRAFYCVLSRKQKTTRKGEKSLKSKSRYLKKLVVSVCDDDVLCCNCRIKCHKQFKKGTQIKETQNKTNDNYSPPRTPASNNVRSPPSVALPFPSTSTSHSSCFVCKKGGPKLLVVPNSARNSVFLQRKLLIPYGARCCAKHILNGNLTSDSMEKIPVLSQVSLLNRSSITGILLYLREIV